MSRKIEAIVEELQAARDMAATNLEEVPFAIRAGMSIQVRAAADKVEPLRKELLAATVPSRLFAVLATGNLDKVKAAGDFLSANGGFVLPADRFWNTVADLIEPSYGLDRVFRTTQHSLLVQALTDAAVAQGFSMVDMPKYRETTCPTRADTISHVRSILRTVGADGLSLVFMEADILGAVVTNQLFDKRVPVLVTGSSEDEHPFLRRLFAKAVAHDFAADFEPSKEAITKILKNAV